MFGVLRTPVADEEMFIRYCGGARCEYVESCMALASWMRVNMYGRGIVKKKSTVGHSSTCIFAK